MFIIKYSTSVIWCFFKLCFINQVDLTNFFFLFKVNKIFHDLSKHCCWLTKDGSFLTEQLKSKNLQMTRLVFISFC